MEEEEEDYRSGKRVEVLMLTSPNRDDFVFPKVINLVCDCIAYFFMRIILKSHLLKDGGANGMMNCCDYFQGEWENDGKVEEAACREALEEAGVRGILSVSSDRFSRAHRK